MEPEALPPGWEIPEEHLPPPEEWWHQNESEEWRNPELPLEDDKILVLDAELLPPGEFPVFSVGVAAHSQGWFFSNSEGNRRLAG